MLVLLPILRGLLPPPLHWAVEVAEDLFRAWPELTHGPWTDADERKVAQIVAEVFDEIPEVNEADAAKMAAAVVVAVRLIANAPKHGKPFLRRKKAKAQKAQKD